MVRHPFSALKASVWISVGGLLVTLAAALAMVGQPGAFYAAFLAAWTFWIQVSCGCLALALIAGVGGGLWGSAYRETLRATLWTWGAVLLMSLPLFFSLSELYPWIAHEGGYTGALAYQLRLAAYLIGFAIIACLALLPEEPKGVVCGPSLVALALLFSLLSVDWSMSLTEHFHSSIFPFIWLADSMVAGLAWLAWTQRGERSERFGRARYQLGKLLFASVFFWGYIAFSQAIIIWTADRPHEAQWYQHRIESGWLVGTLLLAFTHFLLPFGLLLSRERKSDPTRLGRIGLWMLIAHSGSAIWHTLPGKETGAVTLLMAVALTVGVGLFWISSFVMGAVWVTQPSRRKEAGLD